MRVLPLSFVVPIVLAACGGERPHPAQSAPPTSSASVAPASTAPARVVDAYSNYDAHLSPDRTKVLFASRRDGNREFYLAEVAKADAAPIAVTHGPERALGAAFARDGKSVVFLRDTGADENARIYRVGLDGKNETCLTPGPVLHRSMPLEPRRKHGKLVYAQSEVKSPATEFAVLEAGHEPKVVFTEGGPASLVDVTDDGKRALYVRENSASDVVLYELDLGAGKTHRLYPQEGTKAVVNDAAYAPDGARVYVGGDDGAAAQVLLALDAKSGAVKQKFVQADPATASIAQVVSSPRGDRLAVRVDAGDHSEGWMFDAKTLKPTSKLALPLGTITFGAFSDDGAKLTATLSEPNAPADVFAVDVAKGTTEPLRKDARPGLDALPPIEATVETVKAFDGLSIPILVYLPKGARASGAKLPVVAAFHGGPSASSSISWNTQARFYVAAGYAYLEPNVRGSTGYGRAYEMADNREKRADWLKDLASVNAWAKAQPWADPARVIVLGGSYGGYTVLMALSRQPTLWRAGVDYVGVANLFTFLASTDQQIRSAFVDEFGDLEKDRALLKEFSPLHKVDQIVAPLYVYQGQNDPRVPRAEADQVVKALRARGVPVEYQVAANEGHSVDHRENRIELFVRAARFLDENAK